VCRELGVENQLFPRIATAFAAGMGRTGEVCGAVIGGIMCIGVAHGRDKNDQPDDKAMLLTRRFLSAFRDEMGEIDCRALTGFDLSTEEGVQQFRASDVPISVCLRAGGVAHDLALKLIREE
jgi:C_GCAxxG_C_C family probable redox protein